VPADIKQNFPPYQMTAAGTDYLPFPEQLHSLSKLPQPEVLHVHVTLDNSVVTAQVLIVFCLLCLGQLFMLCVELSQDCDNE
jgi:hypothetical protein